MHLNGVTSLAVVLNIFLGCSLTGSHASKAPRKCSVLKRRKLQRIGCKEGVVEARIAGVRWSAKCLHLDPKVDVNFLVLSWSRQVGWGEGAVEYPRGLESLPEMCLLQLLFPRTQRRILPVGGNASSAPQLCGMRRGAPLTFRLLEFSTPKGDEECWRGCILHVNCGAPDQIRPLCSCTLRAVGSRPKGKDGPGSR